MSELKKYGAFGGVFTPSILTILGVIMYMRMGAVIGNSTSIWMTIGIILFAHIVSVTTGLSVSSIATDKKIKAGGIYYMLSRSLGFPIGGAIGLTLFIATALSIALYLIGFSESALSVLGLDVTLNNLRIAGSLTLAVVVAIAFISTSLAMKAQYFILGAIGLSLISIMFGSSEGVERGADVLENPSFALLFGIFFPAVTGFTAGVAMSGDLKDPKKSIPWGTLSAIAVGLVVYISLALFLYYSFEDLGVLATNNNAIVEFAWIGGLVVAGIWGATLSSALGGILGAPRILQAMSKDKITPKVFGKGVGVNNEPRNALILTAIIAFGGILIGDLNSIAEIVAMFYMTAYMFINLSCLLEQWASPDFRPTFKISFIIPLIGAVATFLLMIQLNLLAALISVGVVAILFFWLAKKQLELGSGDVWNSVWSSIVKVGLKNLQKKSTHKRNWEPNILLFSGASSRRKDLLEFSKGIAGGNGMISNFDLVENQTAEVLFPKHQQTKVETDDNDDAIFFRQQECQNIYRGIENIANSYGFSGIDPNTVLMGWGRNSSQPEEFAKMTDYLSQLDMNVLFLDFDEEKGFGEKKTIDIWWSHFAEYCDLSLHLSKLMLSAPDWTQLNVRILYNNLDNSTSDYIKKIIDAKCESNRIDAEIVVVNNELEQKSLYELVRKYSIDTDLIFLELPFFKNHQEANFVERTNALLHEIGTTLVFRASTNFYEDINLDPSLQKEYSEVQGRLEFEKKSVHFVAQTTDFAEVDSFLDGLGIEFYDAHQQFSEGVYNAFQETYGALSRILEDISNDPNKGGEQVEAAIEDFKENRIGVIKLAIQRGLKTLLLESQDMVAKAPNTMNLVYPQAMYKEVSSDSKDVTRNKRRIKKYNGKINFPMAKSITYHLEEYYIKEFKQILHINGISGFVVNNALIKLVETDNFTKESINERLTEVFKKEQSVFQQYSKSYIQKFIQKVVEDVKDLNILRVIEDREEEFNSSSIKKYLVELGRYPAAFLQNQQLLSNQLSSLFQLVGLQKSISNRFRITAEDLKRNMLEQSRVDISYLNEVAKLTAVEYLKKDHAVVFNNASGMFASKMNTSIGEMLQVIKEDVEVINPDSLNEFEKNQENVQFSNIAFRKTVSFALERDFSIPLSQSFEGLFVSMRVASEEVNKVLKLLQYHYSNEVKEEADGQEIREQLQSKIKAYQKSIKDTVTRIDAEVSLSSERLKSILDVEVLLNRTSFSQSTVIKNRAYDKGAKYLNKTKFGLRKLDHKIDDALIKLRDTVSRSTFEYRTKGLLNLQSRVGDFVNRVSLDSEVSAQVPYYYQQLFTGKQIAPSEALIHRSLELDLAQKALLKWNQGSSGIILFTGELLSGKSYVKQNFLNTYVSNSIVKIDHSGTDKHTSFESLLQKATGVNKTSDEILSQLDEGTVLELSDLEYYLGTDENGAINLSGVLDAMKRYYNKLIFVVDCNIHFYNYAKNIFSIDNLILSTIVVQPLSTKSIKEIILDRHNAGGMKFFWAKHHEDDTKLRNINRIFTKVKENNLGNIGSAMYFWLGSVDKVENNVLLFDRMDDQEISFDLKPEWELLLYQVLLRKSVQFTELCHLFDDGVFDPQDELNNLIRSKILIQNLSGEVELNPYALIFVVKYLRQRQIVL